MEKEYRGKGYGKILLKMLEDKLFSFGIRKIWLFTAGFEAPEFYKKQGYDFVVEFEDYYKNGHSRFIMRKKIEKC